MRILSTIPLCILLTGCPGGHPVSHSRNTFINGEHLCFSIDKKDVLNYYTIDSSDGGEIKTVVSSEYSKLNSSYPDACMDVKWEKKHTYVIYYGLNGKQYVHEFSIDDKGNLTN